MLEDDDRRLRLPTAREEMTSKHLDSYTLMFTLPQIMIMIILVKTRDNDYLLGYKGIINTRRIVRGAAYDLLAL